MKDERVKELLNKLLDMFRSGDLPPAVARTIIARQKENAIPSDSWSLGNRILMALQGTEDARGFKQWQEVGRSVTKGAKAIYILAPINRTIAERKIDQETGEEVIEKKLIPIGFRSIPVFRFEDTNGKPLPEQAAYDPQKAPPLHQVAEAFGVENVIYSPFSGNCYGFYTWTGGKKIVLHTHDVRTWFHELGHAIHDTFHPLQGGQVPEQEIVAELFAAAMCELHGIRGYHQYSWDYMKHYSGDDPAKTMQSILRIISDVEECINRVMAVSNIPELQQAS